MPSHIVMPQVINVSNDLGKLLLEGWVCNLEFLTSGRHNSSRYSPSELVQLKDVAVSLCCVPLRDTIQSPGFVLVVRAMGVASRLSSSVLT